MAWSARSRYYPLPHPPRYFLAQRDIHTFCSVLPLMTGLLSLPTELLQTIGSDLGSWKKQLRLVCVQLSTAMDPLVLSHVVINVIRPRLPASVSQLQSLSSDERRTARFIRELSIRKLAPGYDAHRAGAQMVCSGGKWMSARDCHNGRQVEVVDDKMDWYLETAISNLVNLQVIRWAISPEDPKWTQHAVIAGLTRVKSLNYLNLHLSFGCDVSELGLERLADLKRVVISGSCEHYHKYIAKRLGVCIAQSPEMNSIDIDRSYILDSDTPTLHSLLEDAPVIRLKHLGLHGWHIRLDADTLPHLRFLTSLTLTNYRTSLPDNDPCSPSTEDVWSMLRKYKIHLETLSTDSMGGSLIEYLASYSGLTRLYLKNITAPDHQSSNQLADLFYNSALVQHVSTIEDLYILPSYEGKWCFGEHIAAVVAQCSKLRYVKFAVICSEVAPSADPIRDPISLLINTAQSHWHSLKNLSISTAKAESLRNIEDPHASKKHFTFAIDHIARSIMAYIPEPRYQAFLPLVIANSIKYLPQEKSGADVVGTRSRLRYRRKL